MTKSETYAAAVRSLGHSPSIDADGDIFFDADGYSHVLYATESDDQFLRLSVPNILTVANDADYWPVLQAVNTVNCNMKVAKAYLHERMVIISVENLLPRPDEAADVLDDLLFYAHGAAARFQEEMRPK